MSPVLLLSIIMTTLVVLGIGIFLYLSWRKRQHFHSQLAELLDDITEQQNKRKTRLLRRFTDKLNLPASDAQPIAEQLIGAEKLFLQQMMSQFLQQTPDERVYEQLCELLDSYFHQLLALKHSSSDKDNHAAGADSVRERPAVDEVNPVNPDAPPEPDWGDVFD